MRAVSLGAGVLVCLAFIALMLAASQTTLRRDAARDGVQALIEITEREPDRPRQTQTTPAPRGAGTAQAPAPNVEAQMLSRLLSCLDRRVENRPRHCPREPAQEDWRSPQIAVGGDFAQPPPLDLRSIYTQAELETLVMPSCMRDGAGGMVGACARIGARPPPPSRSAEEICEDGGIGPCHPPPFRPEDAAQ